MDWVLATLGRAIDGAEATLGTMLSKARFWQTFGDSLLNERQRLVVNYSMGSREGDDDEIREAREMLARCRIARHCRTC